MGRANTGKILANELDRVLGQYAQLESEIEKLAGERKRLAMVAQRLVQILRGLVGPRVGDRLLGELGLVEKVAGLPGLPGRKPAGKAKAVTTTATPGARKRRATSGAKAAKPGVAEPPMAKGTGVRMLSGMYAGWTGWIGSIQAKGDAHIYTVTLRGPDGKAARTQVTPRSLGRKWDVTGEAPAIPAPRKGKAAAKAGRKAAGARKARAGRTAKKGAMEPANPPADVVEKGGEVRVLDGKFKGWTGKVAATLQKGATVTYALNLRGPAGERGRTQVNHGSLGRTWERAGEAPVAAPARPAKVIRRRPAKGEATQAAPEAAPEDQAAPAPEAKATPVQGILAKGTGIRMLSGRNLGCKGVIVSVQAKPGPNPEALERKSVV